MESHLQYLEISGRRLPSNCLHSPPMQRPLRQTAVCTVTTRLALTLAQPYRYSSFIKKSPLTICAARRQPSSPRIFLALPVRASARCRSYAKAHVCWARSQADLHWTPATLCHGLRREHRSYPTVKAAPTGRSIAVIGAGAAGLSCAGELARLGHAVTVFERRSLPGGLSTYGIIALREPVDIAIEEAA